MKKAIFTSVMVLLLSVACAQQFKVQNPAVFPSISFNEKGFGTATGTGYILNVPVQSINVPMSYAAALPEIFIYPLGQDKAGNYFLSEMRKPGLLKAMSNWSNVYTGAKAPEYSTYTSPRPVTVQIQAWQLTVNGQLVYQPDGRPVIEREQISVFL